MKKYVSAIVLICMLEYNAAAQNKLCNFAEPNLFTVFVFSEKNAQEHSSQILYGMQAPELILNRIYISTVTAKNEIDSAALAGKLDNSIFIYPSKDPTNTIRFCTGEEYAAALRSKLALRIEAKEYE